MTRSETLQARWKALDPRERRFAGWAIALVLLALVWWIALAPALRTLSTARQEHARLDAQLQQMSTLAAQANALKGQPKANHDDALRALESSVRQQLGPNAQLSGGSAGDGVSLVLRATPADTLAPWLAQARGNARALPREAHLTRSQQPAPPAGASGGHAEEGAKVRWDGTLVMSLPAK